VDLAALGLSLPLAAWLHILHLGPGPVLGRCSLERAATSGQESVPGGAEHGGTGNGGWWHWDAPCALEEVLTLKTERNLKPAL